MSAADQDRDFLASLNAKTYETLMHFSGGNERQNEMVKAVMRNIEPLLMTLGNLDAHLEAILVTDETHHEQPQEIRRKMLSYTPITLMNVFIPKLEKNLPIDISKIPDIRVLWQPLTIDPASRELCINSSFNHILIQVNEEITRASIKLTNFEHEQAPSPSDQHRDLTTLPRALRRAPHFDWRHASVSPGKTVSASTLHVDPVVPESPPHQAQEMEVARLEVSDEEEPEAMEVGPVIQEPKLRRSYAVLIHGHLLATDWFEYPIEPTLCNVSYTAEFVCQTAPAVKREIQLGRVGTMKLTGSEFIREQDPNPHKDIIFGKTGEPCPRGNRWVGLNPMLFSCDAPEEQTWDRLLVEPEIGIWAFDAVDDTITGKRNVIDISLLKHLYNTDRSYGTYRLLFDLIKKDLEANPIPPECETNIVYHVCRTGRADHLAEMINKFVILDVHDISPAKGNMRSLYKYPNGAQIGRVADLPSNYVMEMIGFNVTPNVGMHPLGSRHVRHGLHFVLQGCFYNLMVYLGITTPNGGEILTSIQNEGITSRMFLNFVDLMNKNGSFPGLRQFHPATSSFVLERLSIVAINPDIELVPTNGISKLLHVMLQISIKYRECMDRGERPPVHALLVKLFHKRRAEELVHTEEVGHWVAFTIHPEDLDEALVRESEIGRSSSTTPVQFIISRAPWRYVDPQSLSMQTVTLAGGAKYSYTVPMSFKKLQTLDEVCSTLNEFVEKFSHIDLFYIALPPGHVPHSFTLPSNQVTHSGIPRGAPDGGKHRRTKKHLKKSKTKSKTKYKPKSKTKHAKCSKRSNH
jgi:hypothetical protein